MREGRDTFALDGVEGGVRGEERLKQKRPEKRKITSLNQTLISATVSRTIFVQS